VASARFGDLTSLIHGTAEKVERIDAGRVVAVDRTIRRRSGRRCGRSMRSQARPA
jgi:hypothetical protein